MNPVSRPPETAIELCHLTRRFGRVSAVGRRFDADRARHHLRFSGAQRRGQEHDHPHAGGGCWRRHSAGVNVAGCDMPGQRDRAKRLIGYVPDRPTVYKWMTGREAVAFCRSIYGIQWDAKLVATVAKSLRLEMDKPVKHLSKGSAAKLSLLLAIGHNPGVLILDEPTSGFDVLARDEFLEGLLTVSTAAAAAAEGRPPRTVLFSSHSLGDVQRLSDTVAILHQGKLLLHQPIDRLLAGTKRIRAVVDDPPQPTVAPPGTVRESRVGREWTVTVRDFTADKVEFVRGKNRVSQIDVTDLTLDEVFRDYVRGGELPAAS